jgi:hypothetical protein
MSDAKQSSHIRQANLTFKVHTSPSKKTFVSSYTYWLKIGLCLFYFRNLTGLFTVTELSKKKQKFHFRLEQVPKLNRGMRPQVIVKKMQLPKKLDSAEELSDDDVNDLDLVTKRRTSSASLYLSVVSENLRFLFLSL